MLIFVLLGAAACIALYLGIKKTAQKNTQKNSEQILNTTFNGTETATYRVSSVGGLKFDQVLTGAEQRGYTLHAQNQDTSKTTTLVFKKAV